MGFIISMILFSICFFSFAKGRKFAKPEVIFCFEWGLISTFASLRLFGLYGIGNKTWLIILAGSLCFVLGSVFAQKTRLKHTRTMNIECESAISEKKNKKIYWILFVLLSLYKFGVLINCIALLKKGYGLSDIRDISYGYYSVTGYSVQQNVNLSPFINALITLNTALGIYLFITDVKKNMSVIISTFIFAIVQIITDGGRFNIIYLVLELVVCFSLLKDRNNNLKISKKIRKFMSRAVFVLVVILFATTSLREIEINNFFKHFYTYLSGNVVLLDIRLERLDSLGFFSMGYGSFYGFWALLFPVLRLFLGFQLPELWNKTITYVITAQENFTIGDNIRMNAFVTPYYYLYADMGMLGIILGMLLFGFFAGVMYKKAVNSNGAFEIINYLIISQMIFKTLQLYPTVNAVYVLLIIYFIFGDLFRKVRFDTYKHALN